MIRAVANHMLSLLRETFRKREEKIPESETVWRPCAYVLFYYHVESQQIVGGIFYTFPMKNNIFGKIIKQLCLSMGLSQEEVGRALGYTNQTIAFWENCRRDPNLDALVSVSEFFV